MKKRKFIFITLAVFLTISLSLLTFVAVINAIVVGSAAKHIRNIEKEDGYETAVVFGAGVYDGGILSAMLQDRMDTAIALYKRGAVSKLLLSGDNSVEWGEVKYMKRYAVEHGVNEDDILEDGEGYSTMETVTRAKKEFGLEKCVFVTQKYHLYRAIYSAKRLDMDVVGESASVRGYRGQIYRDMREILARVKDFCLIACGDI